MYVCALFRALSIVPFESAITTLAKPAAAQLDKFCCTKFWTRTVLAESPGFTNVVKHGPIDSNGTIDTALTTLAARRMGATHQ